jgi:hypothetical protein
MARLIGPSEASREVKAIVSAAGVTRNLFQSKAGRPATFYTDSAATQLADILTLGGAPIAGSALNIDAYSMLPLFQFPDGLELLYVVVDGGPAWPVYAREDDRLDALVAAVAAEASTRATADSAVVAAAATDATSKATAAQSAAISTAATDATTKANAAQAAAVSAAATDATARVAAHAAASDPHGDRAAAAAALAAHEADNTGVHGIADTSVLETTTGAQSKATAAQTAAIIAAATDATTKANAAQSAATTAAAVDATTKVGAEATARSTADALLTPMTRTVTTTAPLTGGGDLSANRTIAIGDASSGAKGVVQLAGDLGGTANAPTVPGLVGKVGKGDLVINVRDYGATGDGRRVSDAAMTSGSATLTSATAVFTNGDVGKRVVVWNAGTTTDSYAVGVAQQLATTIVAYVNATTVTLATTATTTVSSTRACIATDDTTAVANAQAALTAGKELHFPGTSGFYFIRSGIVASFDGFTVSASSTDVEVHLSHPSYPMPGIDAIDRNDVTVRNITFVSEDGHIWSNAQLGAAPYRGDGPMLNHSAVWCNADRLTVDKVHSTDFENSVYLSPWNTTLSSFAQDGRRADCVIRDLESTDEFCALLALSTTRLKLRNIFKRGYRSLYAAPGHAVYHSGSGVANANYPAGLFSVDFDAKNLWMIDDTTSGGGTISLKYIRGGIVSDVYARGNPLLYSVQLERVTIDRLFGLDMTFPAGKDLNGNNFICVDTVTDTFGFTNEVEVSNVRANTTSAHAAGGAVGMFFHGNNVRVRDVDYTTYRDSTVTTSQTRETEFWGPGMRVENLRIRNAAPNDGGSSMWPIFVGNVAASTDIEFVDLALENWRYMVRVNQPYVTDLRMSYSPAAMVGIDNRATTAPVTSLGGTFTALRLQPREHTRVFTVSAPGQTIVPSPAMETTTQVDASTADAFTVGAPVIAAKPYPGTKHRVGIRNSSGGLLGTITWNAALSLRTAFVAPPAGETHIIDFLYDGTVWREALRSTGAVTDTSAALTSLAANALAVGEIAPARGEILSTAIGTVSGVLYLTYFTADKTEAITTVTAWTGGTAAAATPTLCRYGVYSVAGNGDLTQVAATVNDTALFAAANTAYPKALSATWNKVAGQRYAVGPIIVSGAATPTFHGKQLASTSVMNTIARMSPAIVGRVTGLTDLPSSVTVGTLVGYQGLIAIQVS